MLWCLLYHARVASGFIEAFRIISLIVWATTDKEAKPSRVWAKTLYGTIFSSNEDIQASKV